mmetsp:Transcript_7725/g.13616  ORF Transcript_7725/g.13616 Transcript_7725/m.13616 type:complete len:663 (-) Transcript_7725:369-2357(-)
MVESATPMTSNSTNHGNSGAAALQLATRPPLREVARAMSNLGNTCYMNAVLQALAHAPELCMALDVQSHQETCPIYKENIQKIANRSAAGSAASSRSSSPDRLLSASQTIYNAEEHRNGSTGTRKSRRTRSPTNAVASSSSSLHDTAAAAATAAAAQQIDPNATKFCALCELEHHLKRVHRSSSSANNSAKPVAPSDFVHGFIDHVAPWFKLGQQEDSHEFLRLLIDAMQKSCKQARPKIKEDPSDSHAADQGNPQDTPPEDPMPQDDEDDDERQGDSSSPSTQVQDQEYPFQLFRGMVQSKVTCGQCHSTSSTLDPIEDLGLEVTPSSSSLEADAAGSGNLASVEQSLQRFARVEELDAGYKCEKCGKVGRATKQSRLASIPPILTLHLKRFRYGAATAESSTAGLVGNGQNNHGSVSTRRSQRSSEVSQLLSSASTEWISGKTGSAKIEGHSPFKHVLDLKPFLTDELQDKLRNMLCRLFAVIVHVGKNSHSGHYLAYVRNIAKNEWWKMDDARVTPVNADEVLNAEAYMLFYRVVDHQYSKELANQVKILNENFAKEQEEAAKNNSMDMSPGPESSSAVVSTLAPSMTSNKNNNKSSSAGSGPAASVKNNPRKRKAPEFTCGEDWVKKTRARVPDDIIAGLRDIEAKWKKTLQMVERTM